MRYYQKGEFQRPTEIIKNPEELFAILLRCWCAETCTPRLRNQWKQDNPTLGQCAVTAFLVQDLLGGEVYGIPLKDGGVHCFNVVDQCLFDLTSEQFQGEKLDYDNSEIQSRHQHFQRKEKQERYELLREKVLQELNF
ncbi:MAG: hypothetical protein IKR11_00190 [Solobacterium sp.]|nr:hypothetical protein [Solobacterium sp.]